jgi:hypothetical protein
MLINWIVLFPPRFEWDREYCNQFVIFNPEDETDITFTGKSWTSSVLARGANPTSFTLSLIKVTYLAIGIAPKQLFNPNGATMFSCGCYLYNDNSLYSGGITSDYGIEVKTNDSFPRVPQVYQSGSILTCFYNREKGELSFTYNGIDLGVGYSRIPKDRNYYAAVSVHSGDAAARIKLLDMTFNEL